MDFAAAYRELEGRMNALAEADGNIYLPSPEPEGAVQYIFICMEPGLRRWSHTPDQGRSRVKAGFRNFLSSMGDFILHFCARHYLCRQSERYHITDWSKGAMPVADAGVARSQRYDRWYPLLLEEIGLLAAPGAGIIAVGRVVAQHLLRRGFNRPFRSIIHYSAQAGRARNEGIIGHEQEFEEFKHSVSHDDVMANAREVFSKTSVPAEFREATLSRLGTRPLTESHKKLMFCYKLVFESMRL